MGSPYSRTFQHIEGNETTNKAARDAAINSPDSEIISFSSLVYGYQKKYKQILRYCIDLWNTKWHTTTENKLREIKNSVEPWPKYTDLNAEKSILID